MLTPVADKVTEAQPIAGSNEPAYGDVLNPLEQLNESLAVSEGGFLAQILAKEREVAKLRIRRSGENARNVIEIGDIHFLNRKFPRARDAYLRAIQLDKKNVAVYKKLINCYIALSDVPNAAKYYERLIEISPTAEFKHEYVMFRIATSLGDDDLLQGLKKDIKSLVEENSSDSKILNTYGMFLGFVLQQQEESKQYFEKAIDIDRDNFHAINNLGVYFKFKNQFPKALEKFKQAVDISPKYQSGYENMASVYIAQEDYDKALVTLETSLSAGVQLSDLWIHKIGWLLIMLGRFEEAIKWYKDRVKKEPSNDLLLNNLGYCYQKTGDIVNAQKNYENAIDCFEANLGKPSFVADVRSLKPYRNLMVLADTTGKTDLMDKTAKRLLAIDPNSPMALYFRGQAQYKKKNFKFAQECFERSIEGDPTVAGAYIGLSFIYEAILKDYKKTLKLLEGAPFSKTSEPLIANNLAYAYIKNGDLEKAKQLLGSNSIKDIPPLYATRGLIELYENKLQKAEAYYKKAIASFSADEKDSAVQVWNYEQAYYWNMKKDYKLAIAKLDEALSLGDISYAYSLAKELRDKL